MNANKITAAEALEKLKEGNKKYIDAEVPCGNISPVIRRQTCENGQTPYAVIISCSDSRVIPENIFSAGIGELFVIRVAGNVIDKQQLGSIEYAAEHLGSPLVLVLGHDHCGAINAAIHSDESRFIKYITDEIRSAIGTETDDLKACCLNIQHAVHVIEDSIDIQTMQQKFGLQVCGAVYHIKSGEVEFLP